MTKPVVAVAVLQLVERGGLSLGDPVSQYIPEFASTAVAEYGRAAVPSIGPGAADELQFSRTPDRVVPARRSVTIRDLLTHSSGLGQSADSLARVAAESRPEQTLAERVAMYAAIPGDSQPGAEAAYSPVVGFDVLGRIVEIVSGVDLQTYLTAHILRPLGMVDTTFVLDRAQQARLVALYEYADGGLRDVSTTDPMVALTDSSTGRFSGAGGLFSTVDDYDRFAQALALGGTLDDATVLRPESVALLVEERSPEVSGECGDAEWGLGVLVQTADSPDRSRGSWGWSGAYGTHLVIDPVNHLTIVLMVNRSNIGGSDSEISRRVEHETLVSFARRP